MSEPLVKFYQLIPGSKPPVRADRAAGGTLPTRAFRYCEAIRTASSYGWYVFPAMDFSLMWDGSEVCWKCDGHDSWNNLDSIQYPGFLDYFNSRAPEELNDCAPPLLGTAEEPGIVQIWSGLIARTKPDWSLLIRSPANLSMSKKYQNYEGIVETDKWFGPLFTNIRLTRTDVPIDFSTDRPIMQVQPVQQLAYDEKTLGSYEIVEDLESMTEHDWDLYHETLVCPGIGVDREKGYYAKNVRRIK